MSSLLPRRNAAIQSHPTHPRTSGRPRARHAPAICLACGKNFFQRGHRDQYGAGVPAGLPPAQTARAQPGTDRIWVFVQAVGRFFDRDSFRRVRIKCLWRDGRDGWRRFVRQTRFGGAGNGFFFLRPSWRIAQPRALRFRAFLQRPGTDSRTAARRFRAARQPRTRAHCAAGWGSMGLCHGSAVPPFCELFEERRPLPRRRSAGPSSPCRPPRLRPSTMLGTSSGQAG